MVVSPGKNLGPYEIIAPLGAGGMGEVYRARDTRLGRDVAVKILPSELSDNADRLLRFEQEACAAGALNHPNILAIYDVGKHDGSPFLVSELLEGETLREKTHVQLLPQKKAIDYALQIARGLAAAHEKGIVHRDLKPENIFVTKDGRVKILDFGLAKLTEHNGDQRQSSIPTRRIETDPGTVMGTVGYMSPEQVRGQAVDHRSDIFSFGTILYEMLTGCRAFQHESRIETLNAILKEDPPGLSELNSNINPALERIVSHCLEKDPEQRFHSASDLAFALDALSGTGSITSGRTTPMPAFIGKRVSRRELAGWTIAGVTLLAAAVGLFVFWQRRGSDLTAAVSRFLLVAPEKMSFGGPPIISPDGRNIVSRVEDTPGKVSLWIRPIDSLEGQPLPGTENGGQPFWSPDSRTIAFFVEGKLKKIDIVGGPPQTICDARFGLGGTWGRDGVIVFGKQPLQGLYSVPATGGEPTQVTTLDKDKKEIAHRWPYFLPDGRHFLYSVNDVKNSNPGIYVGSLDSNESKLILPGIDSSMSYAPPGYLLFVRDHALLAQAFDVSKLEVTGDAFPVVDRVAFNVTNGRAHFSVSETGTLVFRAFFPSLDVQLAWVDRAGKVSANIGEPGPKLGVELSPDEKRVAEVRAEPSRSITDIWLIEPERGAAATRLTLDPAGDVVPIWSPDGSQIVFCSTREGVPNIYQKLSSGAGTDELLVKSDAITIPTDWSRDGHYLLYQQISPNTGMDLWVLPMTGDRTPFLYLQTEFTEYSGRFSPDGRWVAYVSNESGRNEIYVRSFPISGGRWQVSTAGGAQPRWRDDGKELFYLNNDDKLAAVDVKTHADVFEVGIPKTLFEVRRGFERAGDSYDAANDGQRFLVFLHGEETAPSPFVVVKNWLAESKR